MDAIAILLSGNRGIYIPRDFVQCFLMDKWHVSEKTAEFLANGPDQEWYWDTWNDVLNDAYYEKDGHTWRLYQDGDLFAYCNELMTDTEYEEFWGEPRD